MSGESHRYEPGFEKKQMNDQPASHLPQAADFDKRVRRACGIFDPCLDHHVEMALHRTLDRNRRKAWHETVRATRDRVQLLCERYGGTSAWLFRRQGPYLLPWITHNTPRDRFRLEVGATGPERGIVVAVYNSARGIYAPDVANDERYRCVIPHTRSEIAVPIIRPSRDPDEGTTGVEAVLNLESSEHDRFSEGLISELQEAAQELLPSLLLVSAWRKDRRISMGAWAPLTQGWDVTALLDDAARAMSRVIDGAAKPRTVSTSFWHADSQDVMYALSTTGYDYEFLADSILDAKSSFVGLMSRGKPGTVFRGRPGDAPRFAERRKADDMSLQRIVSAPMYPQIERDDAKGVGVLNIYSFFYRTDREVMLPSDETMRRLAAVCGELIEGHQQLRHTLAEACVWNEANRLKRSGGLNRIPDAEPLMRTLLRIFRAQGCAIYTTRKGTPRELLGPHDQLIGHRRARSHALTQLMRQHALKSADVPSAVVRWNSHAPSGSAHRERGERDAPPQYRLLGYGLRGRTGERLVLQLARPCRDDCETVSAKSYTDRPFTSMDEELFHSLCVYLERRFRSVVEDYIAKVAPHAQAADECSGRDQLVSTSVSSNARTVRGSAPPKFPTGTDEDYSLGSCTRLAAAGERLVGRDEELERLHQAWDAGRTSAIQIVSAAGFGKTCLTRHWIKQLKEQYTLSAPIIEWTFYPVEYVPAACMANFWRYVYLRLSGPDRQVETFQSQAVPEKAREIASLLHQRRAILVLDGVEALFDHCKYSDAEWSAIARLLEETQKYRNGMVILVSQRHCRRPSLHGRSSATIRLGPLTATEGAELLYALDVRGPRHRLALVSEQLAGHPLTLDLLAGYVALAHDGRLPDLKRILPVTPGAVDPRRSCDAVLANCEMRLSAAQQSLMRVTSFFTEPAGFELVRHFLESVSVEELTEGLEGITFDDWRSLLRELQGVHLLRSERPLDTALLDAHPVVRQYFRRKLCSSLPDVWRGGHQCLFRIFKQRASCEDATQRRDSELLRAFVHGCHGRLYRDVCRDIYWKGVTEQEYRFNERRRPSPGQLARLLPMLTIPESRLSRRQEALIQSDLGLSNFGQGFLFKAHKQLQQALRSYLQGGDWVPAARVARLLREVLLVKGRFDEALEYAEETIAASVKSNRAREIAIALAAKAQVLHQRGDYQSARDGFQAAEEKMGSLLCSYSGYWYCDFLLDECSRQAATGSPETERTLNGIEERCKRMVALAEQKISEGKQWHADLGQALQISAQLELVRQLHRCSYGFSRASSTMDRAVSELRRAGQVHHLASALLVQASLFRVGGALGDAQTVLSDVTERLQIQSSGMRTYEAELELEWALLYRLRYRLEKGTRYAEEFRRRLQKAAAIVREVGYGRLLPRIRILEQPGFE